MKLDFAGRIDAIGDLEERPDSGSGMKLVTTDDRVLIVPLSKLIPGCTGTPRATSPGQVR